MRTHARLDCLSPVLVFPGPSIWNKLGEAWGAEAWGYPHSETPLANAVFGPWGGPLSALPELYYNTVIEGKSEESVTVMLKGNF